MRAKTRRRSCLLLGVAVTACAGPSDTPRTLLEELNAPAWSFPAESSFEVGTQDGEPYQLDQVRGVVRLANGNVAILDGGSSELRVFDREGSYVETVASRGAGPGELQMPWTMYRRGDTIFVVDTRREHLLLFGPDGRFIDTRPPDVHGGTGNVYLHDASVVSGSPDGVRRPGMDDVITRLPRPGSYVREIRLAGDDRLWIRSDTGSSEWFVVDGTPAALGRISIPDNFTVHEAGRDYVLGVWEDSLGVQSVRAYDLPAGDGQGGPRGEWGHARTGDHTSLRELLERVELYQEHYYSRPEAEYTYTTSVDDLRGLKLPAGAGLEPLEIPAGTILRIMQGDGHGWFGVAVDTASGTACAAGHGFSVPVGWTNGTVACF